jgi:predicted metal-binding protein
VKGHDPDRAGTVVLLCRGCCCGTRDKHPKVDHDAQEHHLETAADAHPGVELRVVECLDECDRSNVAVLRRPGVPAKERDTWLGGLLTDRATTALAAWIAEGGDGPLPDALSGLRFRHVPPRRRARC